MSSVSTGDEEQGSAYKDYGAINIGYIPNWIPLSNIYKKKVITKRKNQ